MAYGEAPGNGWWSEREAWPWLGGEGGKWVWMVTTIKGEWVKWYKKREMDYRILAEHRRMRGLPLILVSSKRVFPCCCVL